MKLLFWEVLPLDFVCNAVQGGSNFRVCGWNPKVWLIKIKPSAWVYFPVGLFVVVLLSLPKKAFMQCLYDVQGRVLNVEYVHGWYWAAQNMWSRLLCLTRWNLKVWKLLGSTFCYLFWPSCRVKKSYYITTVQVGTQFKVLDEIWKCDNSIGFSCVILRRRVILNFEWVEVVFKCDTVVH